jgi:hypothetical protein
VKSIERRGRGRGKVRGRGRGKGKGTKGSSKVVLMLSTSVNRYKEFLIQRKNL